MSEDPAGASLGHNSEKREKVVWERWTKKRTFVRALEGTYGQLKEELYSQPRVYRTSDMKWKGGPQHYGKKVINPQANRIAQSIEAHVEVFSPKVFEPIGMSTYLAEYGSIVPHVPAYRPRYICLGIVVETRLPGRGIHQP